MNKIKLKNYILRDNKSGFKTKEYHLKNNYPSLYEDVLNWSIKHKNITYLERLYLYIENITEIPLCLTCKGSVKFEKKINKGYRHHCSKKCSNNDPDVIKKIKTGNIISQNTDEVKNKIKKNIYNKYGVEHHLQLDEFKEKSKKTNLEKYGVEYPSQSEVIKEKSKRYNIEKYGVENPFQSEEIKSKIKEINQKKYGVEFISQSEEIKVKVKESNLEKYGVDVYTKSNEYKIKSKKTNLEKYGVDNIFKSSEFKKNLKIENEKRYKNRWEKLLNINIDDISYGEDNLFIKKYCKIHLDGFEITKGLLYDRAITCKLENICTICNPISEQSSIKENEIKNFIKNELKIDNIIENDRTILNGKELDIYLPNHNLAIEFNGLYYHSELFKNKNYHFNKTELCENKAIQLLHIFEDEWIYKSDIVKSIIKSKLGLIETKIYGRKTEVKEVNTQECRKFLDDNHIQGFVGNIIKLGLYHNNELVSLMCFSKLRKGLGNKYNNPDQYNLSRFCNKQNTIVIGGASKLIKYFTKNYKPKKIVSYADKRWSDGNLYLNLGFKKIHTSKPDYYYFNSKELIRYHRFNFRKDMLNIKIKDINKTEHELMLINKYYRIYDSGKIRFELNMS